METYSITGERKEELIEIAQVLGVTITAIQELTPDLSDIVILNHNHQDLIQKANELFQGTAAEIPQGRGEVENVRFLKRAAIITASHLLQYPYLPITPLQSEQLLQQNQLPKDPSQYWEDLALILYDLSPNGTNPEHAESLFQKLKSDLGKSKEDLPLLIVNAGLKPNLNMPHNIEFTVLPITKAYSHPTLERTGQDHNFEYGLEHGLPSINDLGKGNRTLYVPLQSNDLGLSVLCRSWGLGLNAWNGDLVGSNEDGRVTLARTIF